MCDHGRAVGRAERVAAARGHAGGGPAGARPRGAAQLARSIGTAWLASVKAGFEASGAFFEKYDADARGKRGAGGEYEPQDGFGWTLGAAAAMVERFHCDV